MQENEAIARRFFDDVWSGGRYDVLDVIVAGDHQHHISGDTSVGPAAVAGLARSLRGAFSDLRFTIEDTMVAGDKVLVRWTARGTHTGTLGDLEASGREVAWTGMDLVRLADHKIVEIWGNNDGLGLWEQLT